MKTIYFIINYLIQLFFTLVFHIQVQEMHLKPVKVKSKGRPHRSGFFNKPAIQIEKFINDELNHLVIKS